MKTLLVNPPQVQMGSGYRALPPLVLLYLGSFLKKHAYPVQILDLSHSRSAFAYFRDYLRKNQFDIIGFTGTTFQRFLVWDLAKTAKETLPNSKIVAGGRHFSAVPQETLESIQEIDVVVRGEGEITLLELIKSLSGEMPLQDVAGISYRQNGVITHNGHRINAKDIEQFTLDSAIEETIVLPHGRYDRMARFANFEDENIDANMVTVGRGCPYKCIFCGDLKRFVPRYRSIDGIIAEVKKKIAETGCRFFMFWDPHIAKKKTFFADFCERLIQENIEIKWWADTRADIEPTLIDKAKMAGCVSLDIGLESASQRVIDTLKKEIKVEQVQALVDKCHLLGLRCRTTIMFSLPGETDDDLWKTMRFLADNKSKLSNIMASPAMILPGTEMEMLARKRGIIDPSFSWYDRDAACFSDKPNIGNLNVPVWIEHFDREKILRIMSMFSIISKGWEWDCFIRHNDLTSDARIGIYSAGETTAGFLDHMLELNSPPFRIECIIDKYKQGQLHSLPIVDLESALQMNLDFIIITTFAHHFEVNQDLAAHGLTENKDFAFVYFFNDMIQKHQLSPGETAFIATEHHTYRRMP